MSVSDTWAIGDAYERYVGRWSRLVAGSFLDWLAAPAGRTWLDVGCGTGSLAETILRRAEPASVVGIDPAEGFIADARARLADVRASFLPGDAMSLPFDDAAFDAVVSGLALNFVPRHGSAVAEMARVARPGGIVAACVWDYADGMQMMRIFWDAAVALDEGAADLDEGRRFPVCRAEALEDLFRTAGLADVQSHAIEVATRFVDFDDFWQPFLGGQGPAPGYAASLTDGRREALRERIRSTLPIAPDGGIALSARAWAVRGRRGG